MSIPIIKIKQFTGKIIKKPKKTWWILIGTLCFVSLIVYGNAKIYNIALEESKRNHQNLQKKTTLATAASLRHYLKNMSEELHLLATFTGIQNFEKEPLKTHLENFYMHANRHGVKAVFITNHEGNIFSSTSDTIPVRVRPILKNQVQWAQNHENWNSSWFSPVMSESEEEVETDLYFLVLVPIFKNSRDAVTLGSRGETVGLAGYLVDFDWIMKEFVIPVNSDTVGSAWVMDGRGRLLYHAEHPDMILRDISDNSSECISCHTSFELQNHIITADAGSGEYSVGDEPMKIMSHVPIDIQGERWVLVLTTHLTEVTHIFRRKFGILNIHLASILIIIVFSGILNRFIETKRIRAEEAHSHIKQKKELQHQIDHIAKLASIGELVDTVAHEINTPISIIAAQSDALRLQQTEKSVYDEELRIIREQIRRISDYTSSLLDHSQNIPFNREQTDLTRVLDDCLYLLGHRFRAQNIIIKKNIDENLPQAHVDRRQVEQVIINLLNNAIDAMDGDGEIAINMHLNMRDPIEGIDISIADNGGGIPNDVLPQIFKPFFSTKSPGKGTGLGLSITKSIIQRHHGEIRVESTQGQGTTFFISFPLKG